MTRQQFIAEVITEYSTVEENELSFGVGILQKRHKNRYFL